MSKKNQKKLSESKKIQDLKNKTSKQSESKFSKFLENIKNNRKLQLGLLIGAIFIIISTALTVVIMPGLFNKTQSIDQDRYSIDINEFKLKEEEEEIPLTMSRRLDGLEVATAEANKIPVCVMIENAAFSGVRPQSGLSAASVIYELIVEGGITRLMAVYAGEEANPVGPVRSARDTYLEFAAEIDCMYTHAGGSFTAMLALQEKGYKDLDGLREYKYFWRDPTKSSPHNFFTKTDNLYEAVTIGHSWYDPPTYDSWQYKDATEDRKVDGDDGYVSEINILFGGAYDVTYKYDPENNNYKRWNGNSEHIDKNTGQVLTTNNIIVQKVSPGWQIEGKGRINFDVTGEGDVHIFREGEVVAGTWKKPDRLSRTKFYDGEGEEIELLKGNSWVEIVPETRSYNWK